MIKAQDGLLEPTSAFPIYQSEQNQPQNPARHFLNRSFMWLTRIPTYSKVFTPQKKMEMDFSTEKV